MGKSKTTTADPSKVRPIKSAKAAKPRNTSTEEDNRLLESIIAEDKTTVCELSMNDVENICLKIATGMLVKTACKQEGISEKAFWNTVTRREEARAVHIHARVSQAWLALEKIAQVEDDLDARRTDPQTAKVLLDSLRWRLGKMLPLQFGEQKTDGPVNIPVTITAILAFDPSGRPGSEITITPITNENKQLADVDR